MVIDSKNLRFWRKLFNMVFAISHKMNKNKKLMLGLSLIASIFLTFCLVYFFTEKYFFDKIFYKKSSIHGYFLHKGELNDPVLMNNSGFNFADLNVFFKNRLADLLLILDENQKLNGQDQVFKIAVIGDSIAYGLGVKNKDRFTHILEKKLRKNSQVKVYNFSMFGDDLLDNYIKYKLIKEKLDIDLFIITLVDNDLIFIENDKYPKKNKILSSWREECSLPLHQPSHDIPDSMHWNDYFIKEIYPAADQTKHANFCIAKKIAESFENESILTLNFSVYENDYSKKFMIQFLEIFSQRDIRHLDLGKSIKAIDPSVLEKTVSKMETHPSKKLHQFYADLIFNHIVENIEGLNQ